MNGKLAVRVGKATRDLVKGLSIVIDREDIYADRILEVMRNTFKSGLIETEKDGKIELALTDDIRQQVEMCSGLRIKKDDGTYKFVPLT